MSEGSTSPMPPGSGERRRTLGRAPGERYAAPVRPPGREVEPARASGGPVFLAQLLTSLIVAGLFAIGIGWFDLRWPLLVLAAAGGWAIGSTGWRAAWPAANRAGPRAARAGMGRVTGTAIAFALATWVAGQVGGWAVSQWLLPNSSMGFAERLSSTPFLDWLAPQFGSLEVVEILLLGGLAWFVARPR